MSAHALSLVSAAFGLSFTGLALYAIASLGWGYLVLGVVLFSGSLGYDSARRRAAGREHDAKLDEIERRIDALDDAARARR